MVATQKRGKPARGNKPSCGNNYRGVSGERQLGFPKDFIWGVSTSAYQIEGAASEDGKGPSIWDIHCLQKGRVANGDTGDVACDHYHHWPDDVGLMTDIGVSAYRFSMSWPRVLPRGRGQTNEKGLDFYDRLIDRLLATGIEPWLCLYHWDLPKGLDELGGWLNRDIAGWFADYATLIARRYGDRVKRLATFNEPSVFTLFGYGFGWNAPAVADRTAHLVSIHHVNLAHGAAIDVLRTMVPGAKLGIIHNRQPCHPENGLEANKEAALLLDEHWNKAFPDPQLLGHYSPRLALAIEPFVRSGDMARICRPIDWFGLNHYSPIYARADATAPIGYAWGNAPVEAPRSGIGWPIYPEAFHDELINVASTYKMPIYVTENGCGGSDMPDSASKVHDQERVDYLRAYTNAMKQAMDEGADVRGYFVWSLLDNFEWGSGYGNRFGLVWVDFATQTRIPKDSAAWYAALIHRERGC